MRLCVCVCDVREEAVVERKRIPAILHWVSERIARLAVVKEVTTSMLTQK